MKEISRSPDEMTLQEEICHYHELLECLEKEWHALLVSEEEAILRLAAEKEQILETINQATSSLQAQQTKGPEDEQLHRLKRRVAAAQARNHRLIAAALETVQDFLGYLQSGFPGTYQAAGKVDTSPGNSYFHRQA